MQEFCTECGAAAEASDRFCRQCGQTLGEHALPSENISGWKKKRLALLVAGLGVVGAVAATAGILAIGGDETSESVTPTAPSKTGAAKALATEPELSGTWEGDYRADGNDQQPVEFTFAASFNSARISGTIMEPHTLASAAPPTRTATVEGSIEGASVRFTKRYGTGEPIVYEGVLNPQTRTIEGRWTIGVSASAARGTFRMAHRSAEQRVVAAAPPPPPADPLPSTLATRLLKSAEATACRMVQGVNLTRADATRLVQSVDAIFNEPGFDPNGQFSNRPLSFEDGGHRYIARYTHGFGNWEYASLDVCVHIPSDIDIVDTDVSPSGDTASIIYKAHYVWSVPAARAINDAGGNSARLFLSSYPPYVQYENRATLRKLDRGGWRVETIQTGDGRNLGLRY